MKKQSLALLAVAGAGAYFLMRRKPVMVAAAKSKLPPPPPEPEQPVLASTKIPGIAPGLEPLSATQPMGALNLDDFGQITQICQPGYISVNGYCQPIPGFSPTSQTTPLAKQKLALGQPCVDYSVNGIGVMGTGQIVYNMSGSGPNGALVCQANPSPCQSGSSFDKYGMVQDYKSGKCVSGAWGAPCPSGYQAQSNAPCLDTDLGAPLSPIPYPTPNLCPPGYASNGYGGCSATTAQCPQGYSLGAGNRCYPNTSQCGAGYQINSYGQCVPLNPVSTCGAGFYLDATNRCVRSAATYQTYMGTEKNKKLCTNDGGTWIKKSGKQKAYCQMKRIVSGAAQQCPTGYSYYGGQCYPMLTAGTSQCPAGSYPDSSGNCLSSVTGAIVYSGVTPQITQPSIYSTTGPNLQPFSADEQAVLDNTAGTDYFTY